MKEKIYFYKNALKGILSAIYNILFNHKQIKRIRNKRKQICDTCTMNSKVLKEQFKGVKFRRKDEHCTLCQCNLFLKQYSLKTKCPNNLWQD